MLEVYICYFTENQCKRLKEKLQGKTFFNFDIAYSNECGNCTLIVRSNIKNYSISEMKEFFIHYCISELADA